MFNKKLKSLLKSSLLMILFLVFIAIILIFGILNKKDNITIFGYGSLMSDESVKKSMPNACNFRPAILPNHVRIFSFLDDDYDGKPILTIKKQQNKFVKGVIFDIPHNELNNFLHRERHYDIKKMNVYDNNNKTQLCYVCLDYNKQYSNVIKNLNCGIIIPPEHEYLLLCLKTIIKINTINKYFHNSKNDFIENFLNDCYLSDCKTTIRKYIKNNLFMFPDDIKLLV